MLISICGRFNNDDYKTFKITMQVYKINDDCKHKAKITCNISSQGYNQLGFLLFQTTLKNLTC